MVLTIRRKRINSTLQGYALLEYETIDEAKAAIEACKDGLTLMDSDLRADFAFMQPPAHAGRGSRANRQRHRSRSPGS